MQMFGRTFLFPIFVHKTTTYYLDPPNLSIRWNKSRMWGVGKTPTTSFTLEIATPKKRWQWSIVWRPSVTAYWWRQHASH